MPNNRDYKNFALNGIYHIYNRGNAKMDIFLDDEDFLLFLRRLKQALDPMYLPKNKKYAPKAIPENSFTLLAYCLMPNHYHLIVKQNTDLPVSVLISKVCTSYAKCFNKKYGRVGSLYQDEFKAVEVNNNEQLLWLMAYVHGNPLEASLVSDLGQYKYSSHLDYAGLRNGTLCDKSIVLNQFSGPEEYLKAVMGNCDNDNSFEHLKLD